MAVVEASQGHEVLGVTRFQRRLRPFSRCVAALQGAFMGPLPICQPRPRKCGSRIVSRRSVTYPNRRTAASRLPPRNEDRQATSLSQAAS